ncbi:hypothetical protein PTH_2337 [Pelotomaculum thermopropionicum SI]|uniref:Transposase IS4-like domain-containing protein n=1 Tax=Pelotomaculum thermopropionicum (strain DSM 13744 / JCM 10971 / SI) TaxID=370438 RepID=A5CZR2_PELTS|nr:hypothetical protein PTH_2337 [Pelotomaculum thermopropionicum SI]
MAHIPWGEAQGRTQDPHRHRTHRQHQKHRTFSGNTAEIKTISIGPWLKDHILLFDLGYFKYELFSRIRKNEGYFVSRLKTTANPTIVSVLRTYHGNAIDLAGKKLRDVLPLLQQVKPFHLPGKHSLACNLHGNGNLLRFQAFGKRPRRLPAGSRSQGPEKAGRVDALIAAGNRRLDGGVHLPALVRLENGAGFPFNPAAVLLFRHQGHRRPGSEPGDFDVPRVACKSF